MTSFNHHNKHPHLEYDPEPHMDLLMITHIIKITSIMTFGQDGGVGKFTLLPCTTKKEQQI